MNSTSQSKRVVRSTTPGAARSRNPIRSEWPLLLYPAFVAAALALLYVANHSLLQRQPGQRHPNSNKTQPPLATRITDQTNPPTPTIASADGPSMVGKKADVSVGSGKSMKPPLAPSSASRGQPPGLLPSAPVATDKPPGVGRVLGLLRRAVQTNDHAGLKYCLDQLVAAGDDAVGMLGNMIASGDDATCVWAAEALARIGTPAATRTLLDTLAQLSDGTYKEQIAKRVSAVSNHDSWPVLLEAMQATQDAVVQRAASASLAGMADAPIVDELVARYDDAATTDEAASLARAVGSITSPKAAGSLLALAKDITSSVPEDPLDRSILDALANIGDPQCVSFLLKRLESCSPGEGAYLTGVIGSISQPQAQASLLYAAAGNKEVSAEQGRTAAILALKNFPNEQSYVLLQQIAATEQNAAVASAAARTLDSICAGHPLLAANAQLGSTGHVVLPVGLPDAK